MRCLDLFCGSGILSLEALSRGGDEALAIDQMPVLIQNINNQRARFGLAEEQLRTLHASALDWLKTAEGEKPWDLIFLDPPYHSNLLPKSMQLIAEHNLLALNGYLYAESSPMDIHSILPAGWRLQKEVQLSSSGHWLCRS